MPSRILAENRIPKMGRRIMRPILFSVAAFTLLFFAARPAICAISDDFNRKGIEKMQEKNYREAIIYFESAYKSSPENTIIKKNLGVAYHNMAASYSANNESANAIRSEKQALKYDPENSMIREQLSVFYNNYGLEYSNSGNYDIAIENLKQAMEYSVDPEPLSGNLYNVILQYADYLQKKKNYSRSLALAKDAVKLLPDLSSGYIFIGNIYYNQDNFIEALKYWDMALKRDPGNDNLNERIEKLKRENIVENAFGTRRKNYFRIRFDKELDSDYIGLISEILENARREIRSEFNLSSNEVIPVVVYADEQFEAATQQPHWTQGLYDGKIRLKSQDISRGDQILKRVLFHEYAHAIIYLIYGSNIPVWLHEGFAQFNEPGKDISPADKRFLSVYIEENKKFSLEDLNGMFGKRSDQDIVRAAYLQAKIFFRYLMDENSKYKLKRLLKELEQGKIWQEAMKEVYHKNIDRINRDFNNYLDDLLE